MVRMRRKEISFDLDTIKMRELNIYPNGYKHLKVSFKKEGFVHWLGSTYTSREKLSNDKVRRVILNIASENPWLVQCVRKIDITDIGRQHDATEIVKSLDVGANQHRTVEPARPKSKIHENNQNGLNSQDAALLQKIRKTPYGAEFNRLYSGQGNGLAADAKLMNVLAFFSEKNIAQMSRVFKSSALYDARKGDKYLIELCNRTFTTNSKKSMFTKTAGRENEKSSGSYR